MTANPFPWPAGERSETPAGFRTPEQWWRELHSEVQRTWAPILRAMSREQRVKFHAERRKIAKELPNEHDRFFAQTSLDAIDRLFEKWSRIVTEPQEVAAGGVS